MTTRRNRNPGLKAVKAYAEAVTVVDAQLGIIDNELGGQGDHAANQLIDALIAKPKVLRALADVFAPPRVRTPAPTQMTLGGDD